MSSAPNWSQNYTNNLNSGHVSTEMLAPFQSTDGMSGGGGNAVMPTTQIEMTISCRNLLNKDILSKSDPYCSVQMKDSWSEKFVEIGRTETVLDNLNPEWVKKFVISYNFETVQKLRFEVWDVDPDGREFLGHFETTLAEIVAFSGRQFVGKLSGIPNQDCGEIIIVTEELSACKQIVQMQFKAKSLTKISWFWRNDPFLVFSRSNEDSTFSVVLKSEPVSSTQNPVWLPINMRVRTLCNGDYDRTIKIDCYDHRSSGDHRLIGSCHTSLRDLVKGPNENSYSLMHSKKQKNKNYTNSGLLELVTIAVTEEITFLDYIRSGTQMHFAVAIDFTASNGPPRDPQSLHFLDIYGGRLNPYEIALRSVGEIIQHYDSAGMFPAFGFGAKLPPTGEVSHQFPLNGNSSHPYCSGIPEILNHYRNRLASVTLYGPTNFSNVINNTASIARQFQDGKHYFILLIITDGIISDMHQTKNAIVNASKLPISIIIVGVGNADFAAMDELDSDDVRLQVDGKYAERDIVQFVPLNRYLSKNGPFVRSQADLAKEVLAEIPDQMTGYMKSRGFKPIKIVPTDPSSQTTTTQPNAPTFSMS
ncbi:copine-9-like [Oppia nitens]|uniref:copine-9-like n=1 Tax=Oppia nitens TaxID=1686743 RepID=UPI0023DA44A2|nr:copine-9-like [Oppia nitens]